MHVAVIDIGSPKNLGWFVSGPQTQEGTGLDRCIEELASALKEDSLALGFEAPMFVPMRDEPTDLLKARVGEGNRPFSAGAGSSVLVAALVIVPYVLRQLRQKAPDASATLCWDPLPSAPQQLLLFEAFVSHQRNAEVHHIADARLAVITFQNRLNGPTPIKSSLDATTCFNLLGAMMLRTGWGNDPAILEQSCLVVRTEASL